MGLIAREKSDKAVAIGDAGVAALHLKAILLHTPADAGFIELRAISKKGGKPETHWLPTDGGDSGVNAATAWAADKDKAGFDCYVAYNPRPIKGQGTKAGVPVMSASYLDLDLQKFGISTKDAMRAIETAPLKPTLVVNSGHGLHTIWFHSPVADKSIWHGFQDKLVEHFKSVGADDGFKPHEAAILRLAGFTNKKDGSPTSIVQFTPTEEPRSFSDHVVSFGAERRVTAGKLVAGDGVDRMDPVCDLNRNVTLTSEAGKLRKLGYDANEMLGLLVVLNEQRCKPPLPESEVVTIANSVARYAPDEEIVIVDEDTERGLDMNFDMFMSSTFPNIDPVVFGLRPGQLGVFQSVPNCGKTTVLLNLAMSAAVGRSFDPLYEGGRPRRVMYLDHENTAAFLQMDLTRMAESLDEDERRLLGENLSIIVDKFIGEDPLDLACTAHFEAVCRRAIERQPEIIIVDTLAEAFSMANENDNSEMKRVVLTPMKKLAKFTNACVLLVHHIGKLSEGKNNDSLYKGRGASSLAGAARLIINMEHLKDGDGKVVRDHVRVHCAKVKGQAFDDRVFKLDFPSRWFSATDIQITQEDANSERIIALVDHQMKRAEILELLPSLGLSSSSPSTLDRALAFAVSTGLLRKAIRGRFEPTSAWVKRFGTEEEKGIAGTEVPPVQELVDSLIDELEEGHAKLREEQAEPGKLIQFPAPDTTVKPKRSRKAKYEEV